MNFLIKNKEKGQRERWFNLVKIKRLDSHN